MDTIKISTDYADTPGGRYEREGDYSGERFREEILKERYNIAKDKNSELLIDLDGCYGLATSFLEETFGGLVRETHDNILETIRLKSDDEPKIIEYIKGYVEKEFKKVRG